jgi:hypothetical protein
MRDGQEADPLGKACNRACDEGPRAQKPSLSYDSLRALGEWREITEKEVNEAAKASVPDGDEMIPTCGLAAAGYAAAEPKRNQVNEDELRAVGRSSDSETLDLKNVIEIEDSDDSQEIKMTCMDQSNFERDICTVSDFALEESTDEEVFSFPDDDVDSADGWASPRDHADFTLDEGVGDTDEGSQPEYVPIGPLMALERLLEDQDPSRRYAVMLQYQELALARALLQDSEDDDRVTSGRLAGARRLVAARLFGHQDEGFDGDNVPYESDEMTYEEMLEIEDANGPVKSRGLDERVIRNLKRSIASEGSTCVICLADIEPCDPETAPNPKRRKNNSRSGSDEVFLCPADTVIGLQCGHTFHDVCLIPWLRVHGSCPVCRISVAS